jgi:hypothetical protein
VLRYVHGNAFCQFKKKYLTPISPHVKTYGELQGLVKKYDAVIAGSDQIWRYIYVKDTIDHYFLDFVPDGVKKLSYAASFGKDVFEGGQDVIDRLRLLSGRFEAVSVRETSGVEICKSVFGIDAVQVLDPTMLLAAESYEKIMQKQPTGEEQYIACYFLDNSQEKQQILREYSKISGIKKTVPIGANKPNFSFREPTRPLSDYVYPEVSYWLSGIKNARYIITDSFHGLVFSIIFNKQFVCIGNEKRGLSRMYDLLRLFGLDNRLIMENTPAFPESAIDYSIVNQILAQQREKSLNFLTDTLNS